MQRSEIAQAVIVTAELIGHELSPIAAKAFATELAEYDTTDIAHALQRCRRECKGRLTLAAVLERMPGQHPGADEAWAIACRGSDESVTLVWTEEISKAYGACEPLAKQGDMVGARMAFREAYGRAVANLAGKKPRWVVSLGQDPSGREGPVRDAVACGRLPAEAAERYLPPGFTLPASLTAGIGRLPS